MIEKHLKAGQKEQVSTEGSFIYIESSPGQVRVETHPNGFVYILPERGQVRLPDGEKFDRLSFVNESDSAGVVRIISGYGLYIPPNDGQRVNVDSVVEAIINTLPNIVFDGSQPMHFSEPQFVKQSSDWSINSMPHLSFDGEQPVSVGNFPSVQAVSQSGNWSIGSMPRLSFDGEQPVSVGNFPSVQAVSQSGVWSMDVTMPDSMSVTQSGNWSISSMPRLSFDGEQPVRIENFPSVQEVTQTKTTVKALPSIDINGAHTVAANPDRKSLMVIADKENRGTVWLAGFIPLEAGGNVTIPEWDTLSLAGTAGDKVYLGEQV